MNSKSNTRSLRGYPSVATKKTAPYLVISLFALVVGANVLPFAPAVAEISSRSGDSAASATPVPFDAGEPDPLDGDPLDGDPADQQSPGRGNRDPEELSQFAFARSGRPADAPRSQPAYDSDLQTVWSIPDDDAEHWVWFDLGAERPLREVRWLARGEGIVTIELSADREEWREAGSHEVRPGWQETAVRQDARYVRLTLTGEDQSSPPALAEVSAYGLDDSNVELKQRARNDRRDEPERDRDAGRRDRDRDRREPRNGRDRTPNTGSAESVEGVSVEPGETRCRGKRAKCEAREGRVAIEEDCQQEGTCVIDIQADGGLATCDASGSDDTAAGRGEGKRGAEGGRCEATANGGSVTIGDIDP